MCSTLLPPGTVLKGDAHRAHLGKHGLETGPRFGVQAPGDVSCGAHEVLLAFASAGALSLIDEGVVGGAHTLQEQVMAVQELAVPLQEEHGDGQHAPQNVGKAVAKLHRRNLNSLPVQP